ncbi:MAG: hypothetical protein J3K34DRAFT_462223 [Monoraphidium minutum]|nr:MAG: hypothetical protein J3K34DRAFT_462223 [Monoraphidium minutum]
MAFQHTRKAFAAALTFALLASAAAAPDGAATQHGQQRARRLLHLAPSGGDDDSGLRCGCSFAHGMWTRSNVTGSSWTTVPVPGACKMRNLLARTSGAGAAAAAGGGSGPDKRHDPAAAAPPPLPLRALFFGSSVDALFLEAFCDWAAARRPGSAVKRSSWEQIHLARAGLARCDVDGAGLVPLHAWSFGVHMAGPYHEGRSGNAVAHLRAARRALADGDPDIVLLGTGLWDAAREVTKVHGNNQTHPALLGPTWIESFAQNVTTVVSTARELFPRSYIVARTTARVKHDDNGRAASSQAGYQAWHSAMGAALRQLSSTLRLPLVDLELMTSSLGFRAYLKDNFHPTAGFMLEALNLLLNMHAQHAACGGGGGSSGGTPEPQHGRHGQREGRAAAGGRPAAGGRAPPAPATAGEPPPRPTRRLLRAAGGHAAGLWSRLTRKSW